jgi:tetratricopeptide (TPR) repeat protein
MFEPLSFRIKPLGKVLQKAGLISTAQVELALQQQMETKNMRLGAILASRGWLKQETADFFAQLPTKLSHKSQQPLGHYLKQAGLLDEHQINTILLDQKQMGLRFGELAVLKGWIQPATLEFFLEYLAPQEDEALSRQKAILAEDSSQQTKPQNLEVVIQQQEQQKGSDSILQSISSEELSHARLFNQSTIKLFKLDEKAIYPEIVLEEILSWTGAQSFLTQKLCQFLSESKTFISTGEEAATVQNIVQTRLIHDWENQAAWEHFQTIKEGLLRNEHWEPLVLLKLYYQILLQGDTKVPEHPAQVELLRLGLVVQQEEKIKVANRIYQLVFNESWVIQEIEKNLQGSSPTITKILRTPTYLENSDYQHKSPGNNVKRKIWNIGCTISLVIASLSFVGFSFYKWLEEKQLFHIGNELFKQGEYKDAIAKYNKVLSKDSNYYQAWTNRGYALAGLQQYNKMLESCTAATIIEPKAVYAWNCQGEALHNLKNYEEAIAAFDKAIALTPKDPTFRINKAESLLAIQQTDLALKTIDEAIEKLSKNKAADEPETFKRNSSIAFSHKGNLTFGLPIIILLNPHSTI